MAKGWKTFTFNLISGIVGVAIAALSDAPIDGSWVATAIGFLTAANVGLRAVSTTQIFSGE